MSSWTIWKSTRPAQLVQRHGHNFGISRYQKRKYWSKWFHHWFCDKWIWNPDFVQSIQRGLKWSIWKQDYIDSPTIALHFINNINNDPLPTNNFNNSQLLFKLMLPLTTIQLLLGKKLDWLITMLLMMKRTKWLPISMIFRSSMVKMQSKLVINFTDILS